MLRAFKNVSYEDQLSFPIVQWFKSIIEILDLEIICLKKIINLIYGTRKINIILISELHNYLSWAHTM